MGFKMRKSIGGRFLRLNFTEGGYSSMSMSIGPKWARFTYNSKTGKKTLNLPGPLYWTSGAKSARPTRRTEGNA